VFANVAGSVGAGGDATAGPADGRDPVTLSTYVNAQFDPNLSWDDVDWIRSIWDGPLVVKGIQSVPDAVLAAERGVDAIALSNHGGRQLDSSPAPIDLVAPVVDAVGGRTEVICDGGVRRGSDIVKAAALGATACMAGRSYLYALGAAGERGVDHVLAMLLADVRRTMALIGAASIADLDRALVSPSHPVS
jgi:L-lactate dehydrogenase (cytochrome)